MPYQRPTNGFPFTKAQKVELLQEYIQHYQDLAKSDPTVLNRKIPREAFAGLLDRIGEVLLSEASRLAEAEGPIRTFLDANPLPPAMAERLPEQVRVFCLALNALKQWVAAEQAATDRYLLGGAARNLCREAAMACLKTGDPLGQNVELHHPVRDGRPPIPLSKDGHALLEGQVLGAGDDPIGRALLPLRRKTNRSWAQLRRGCLDLLGKPERGTSKGSVAAARSFARKASTETGVGYEQILKWMDSKGL